MARRGASRSTAAKTRGEARPGNKTRKSAASAGKSKPAARPRKSAASTGKRKPAARPRKSGATADRRKPAAKPRRSAATADKRSPPAEPRKSTAARGKRPPAATGPAIRLDAMRRLLPPMADVHKPNAAELAPLGQRVPAALLAVWAELGWGRFGSGFLHLASPASLDDVLSDWLGKKDATRTPLGWTALGDIIYFRDLRERARALGMGEPEADQACDVSVIDVRYKQVKMLAWSLSGFFEGCLGDENALRSELHKDLFDAALARLGPPNADEIYGFVPALGLGGAEDAASLERVDALVHLDILRQL
jgi:hypothetical protein